MSEPPKHRVAKDTIVVFDYAVYDADGDVVEDSEENGAPARALIGYGEIPAPLEAAMIGLAPGETCDVEVGPKDGYGEWDAGKEQWFDRSEFPNDVAVEDELEAVGKEGEPIVLRVVEVTDDAVLVDANHPLAGETVRFDVVVRSVVPASSSALEKARKQAPKARLPVAPTVPSTAPTAEALRSDPLDDEQ